MTDRLTLQLRGPVQAKQACDFVYANAKPYLIAGHRLTLQLKPTTRSLRQNALMWPLLECFAAQKQWPINGEMVWMEPEDWKDVLTAAFHRETVRVAMGLDGGVVMLGRRTSKFTKPQFSDFIEFLYATAVARGVDLGNLMIEDAQQ